MPVSFDPSRTKQYTGPSRDKDLLVKIVGAVWDNNYVRFEGTFPAVAAVITYRTSDGEELVRHVKAGSPEVFAVTPDKLQLTSAKPDERSDDDLAFSPNSEFWYYNNTLLNCGVPAERLGSSLANYVGIEGKLRSFPTGTYKKKDGSTGENLMDGFSEVKKESIKGTGAVAASASASGNASSDDVTKHVATLLGIIVESGSEFAVGDKSQALKTAALKNFVKAKVPQAQRKAVLDALVNPEVVNTIDGYLYDNGTIARA